MHKHTINVYVGQHVRYQLYHGPPSLFSILCSSASLHFTA